MDHETIIEPNSPTPLMREKELLKGAKVHTYKTSGLRDLEAHIFYPNDYIKGESRTTMIFFHGGLWDKQIVSQFVPQALHFVSRGVVAVLVEYRVSSTHKSTPLESLEDAQSAILWLRQNQRYLGVNPHKIIACGAASGAHIALCAAMNPVVDNNGLYDSRPNALVLFSAVVDTTKGTPGFSKFENKKLANQNSPTKNIRKNAPPMIFYHGTGDQTTPINTVEHFCKKMRSKKNPCLFYPFERGTHSFFNFNVNQHNFVQSIESADGFLSEQGFLPDSKDSYI